MKTFIVVLAMSFSFASVSFAGVNRVVSGSCSNGRTWWANNEFDDDGRLTCTTGQDSSGSTYNNCPSGSSGGPTVTAVVSTRAGTLDISVSGLAWVTVHSTANGTETNLVYNFGIVTSASSVPLSSIGTGNFTVVAQTASEYGTVSDATMIII
ncbi:MAG: hypothetical protein HYX66_04435 [Ignavibacteria bacterium]|nr:hypothetical protein [Ignavibacteria bacterium]